MGYLLHSRWQQQFHFPYTLAVRRSATDQEVEQQKEFQDI